MLKAKERHSKNWSSFNLSIIIPLLIIFSIMALPDGLLGSAAAQSQPGEEWVEQDSGTIDSLQSIVWSGEKFVVTGSVGTILTSPDGVNWTEQNRVISRRNLRSVTWSGSQFVAVGHFGTILTSPDGALWTERNSGVTNHLNAVTWSGSQFVAVGHYGTILTSPDGVRWTERNSGEGKTFSGVAWNGSRFVVVGFYGKFLTSPDGIRWTNINPGLIGDFRSVIWAGDQFVAVGRHGRIATSHDGINWTGRFSFYNRHINEVAWSGSHFIAVGDDRLVAGEGYYSMILTSSDGVQWSENTIRSRALQGISWDGSQFVAVGRRGTILTSRGDDKVIKPPTLVSPADGAVIEDESITFRWNASPGANDYFLSIRRTVDNALVFSKPVGNVTSFTQSGFPLNGTEYNWKVRAGSGSVWSDFSEERTLASYKASPDCTVNTPNRPSGPTSGKINTDYTYTTGDSSCAAGHSVQYQFWWSKVDESWNSTGWSNSASVTLSFPEEGTYEIDAQARCVVDNSIISGFSDLLIVSITKPEMPIDEKYTIAYIPVKYKGSISPQPDRTMADLKERAGMVSHYYKNQSYNYIDIVSAFLSDERIELPKSFFQYTLQYGDKWNYYVIRDALDQAGILPDNFDKNPFYWTKDIEEYDAVMVLAPTVPEIHKLRYKGGGAFAMPGNYPNILNIIYVEDSYSYATWAHELGHGIFKWFDYYPRKDYVWTRGHARKWCLMGGGMIMNPPAQVMTCNKALAGWLNYNDLEHDDYGQYNIELLHELSYGDQVYRYEPKAEHGLIDNYIDYFIIEGRNPGEESKGIAIDRYVNESRLEPDLGINLYYQLGRDTEEEHIDADGTYVYRIPYQLSGHEKVTLTPGDSHKCDYHGVKFKAKQVGGQLQLNISEHLITDRCIISAREIKAIIDELDTSKASSLLSDYTLENVFDTNLIVYTDDGEIVGMCYENNEYVMNIPGARSSGNIPGGGPEWISIPSGIEVSYKIDATPAMKWLEELGLAEISIEATVERIEVDEVGERTVIRDDTVELVLYNIILIAKPEEGGEIYGGGVYEPGEEVTISASANEGYKFVNWTENGAEISTESSYSFTVTGSRNLAANFDKVADDPDMEPGEEWEWRNPYPFGHSMYGVTWSGSQFVAVGECSTILTSPDEESWKEQVLDKRYRLKAVVRGDNQLVAVGEDGIIFTSPDGDSWTVRSSLTGNDLNAIVWGDNQFVSVGGAEGFGFYNSDISVILTSPDGKNWKEQRLYNRDRLYGVTWGNNQFVAVGEFGTILTSPDGKSWTEQNSGLGSRLRAVTWGVDRFVAVGSSGIVLTSPDGENWTYQSLDTDNSIFAVTWGGNQFVAVGSSGTVFTSPDGESWTEQNSGADCLLNDVTWGDNHFVAVGVSGTVLTSPDGESWTLRSSGKGNLCLSDVVWCGNQFVTVGVFGDVLTSPDGYNWLNQNSVGSLNAVVWGDNQFVAVGSRDNVFTSPDGVNWAEQDSGSHSDPLGTKINLNDVTWGDNQFVAVGSFGLVLTSPDGENWTEQNSDIGSNISAVTWGDNQFVAVGSYGAILTSPDGKNWTEQNSGMDYSLSSSLSDVTWGDNRFVAVGSYGLVITSPDGKNWTEQRLDTNSSFRAVAWGDNRFVAVGNYGSIFTSPDGENWTEQYSGTCKGFYAVTWGDNQFVTVGMAGVILGSAESSSKCNADLSDLQVNPGKLNPEFTPDNTAYTVALKYNVDSIDIIATLYNSNASMTINSEEVISGADVTVELKDPGTATEIAIVVTAEDEETTKTYTITVNRAEEPDSNDADLLALTVSEGTLTPPFDAAKTDYTVEVTHDTGSIDVTATLSDPEATMTINGAPAISGESETITLGEPGTETEVDITVTDEGGEINNTYIITVKRKVPPVESIEMTVDPENWQITGEDITFTAEVTEGNKEAEFSFWYRVPGRDWVNAKEYSTDNTWTTSTSYVGEVEIRVLARAKGSDAFEEAKDKLDYELFKVEPVEEVKLSADPEGSQMSGEPMTFTVEVSEGNTNAEFAFYYQLPGDNWTLGRSYSEDNIWEPKTSYVGEAKVGVIARALGSDKFDEARAELDYEITALE